MSALTGNLIQNTYKGLIKLSDSTTGVTSVTQSLQDGLGNNLPIQVSETQVNISGSFYINNVPITNGTNGTSGTSGTSGIAGSSGTSGTAGSSGTSGVSGSSGTSGTNGSNGSSGTSGLSGSSGTSGVSGSNGTSGTSGQAGSSGTSGTSGISGSSGTSGIAGSSGTSGVSGSSGTSGVSGSSGTSGTSGIAGSSGTSGVSGSSGTSGISGSSGTSGDSGSSGTSGTSGIDGSSGTSGTSGLAGSSGTSGTSGDAGTSGTSGTSGDSGSSGTSGTSGIDGSSGTSGTSGDSGSSGTSGTSGIDGSSGTSGTSGDSGSSGTSGTSGTSGDSIFAQTGSIYNTTNDLGITGSLRVSGSATYDIELTGSMVITRPVGSSQATQLFVTSSVGNTAVGAQSVFTQNNDGSGSYIQALGFGNYSDNTLDEIGITAFPTVFGISGGTGNSLFVNDPTDSYPAVINFQNKSNWTDGRIALQRNTEISGSLNIYDGIRLYSSQSFNTPAVQPGAYITASNPGGQSNLIFAPITSVAGQGALATNLTGSIVLSGSNNILLAANRTATVGSYGFIGGNNNIVQTIPTLSTSSLYAPTIAGNQIQSPVIINTITTGSLLTVTTVNNNNINAALTLNSNSGSINVLNNAILGSITSTQNTTPGKSNATILNNLINGITSLNHTSSSIAFGNNVAGGVTITNEVSSSLSNNNNGIGVNRNIINGINNIITMSGSMDSNSQRFFTDTVFVGRSNTVASYFVSSSLSNLLASAIIGQNLIVTGSHGANVGGSAFFGRFNDAGTISEAGQIVFAVGTGTSTSTRKTGFWIDSGSNVVSSGSFASIGNARVTGSLFVTDVPSGSTSTDFIVYNTSNNRLERTTAPSGNRDGLITTGSVSLQQELTGSLRMNSGSLKVDDGDGGVKITDYFNRLALYKKEDNGKIIVASNCNMDQVGTAFGVTADSVGLTVIGGNTLPFRSGSNNTWLGSNSNLVSGSQNTFIGTAPQFTGGTGNFILGSFDNSKFNATTYNSLLSIGSNDAPSVITKDNTGPLTFASNTFTSGSATISGSLTITGSLQENVTTITFSSDTGSIDFNSGSYFEATGRNGSNQLVFANVKPGTHIWLKLNSAGGSTSYNFTGGDRTSDISLPLTPSSGYNVVEIVSFGTTPTILRSYTKS